MAAVDDIKSSLDLSQIAQYLGTDEQTANEAVDQADAVYTDAWYSMGQEVEKATRQPVFEPFQVNAELMANAKESAIFLHCLPAHRGDEATNEVLDGAQSRIFPQAHNRLHSARGLLSFLSSAGK